MTRGRGPVEPQDRLLARCELGERFGPQPADRLATDPRGRDHARLAKLADVPAHQRLRQPDVVDELGDARLAASQPLDDPQSVDVRERLVERTERPKLVGLVDDRRDRGADAGG